MIPWWQRIIDPEALVALVVLAAAFGIGRLWQWYTTLNKQAAIKTSFHRWRGFRLARVEGPWPIHLVLGFLTVDVMR